eukprot:s4449_g4.t1
MNLLGLWFLVVFPGCLDWQPQGLVCIFSQAVRAIGATEDAEEDEVEDEEEDEDEVEVADGEDEDEVDVEDEFGLCG